MPQQQQTPPEKPPKANYQGLAGGLVARVHVSCGDRHRISVGLGLDKLFGTEPWLAIVFTAFGVIAAFLNLFRLAARGDGSKQ